MNTLLGQTGTFKEHLKLLKQKKKVFKGPKNKKKILVTFTVLTNRVSGPQGTI